MKSLERFDQTDRRIISLLMEKPDTSQIAMARCLKLSQPAVYARIQRLRSSGMISRLVGVNLNKTNLHVAKVEITAKDPRKIAVFFNKCPMYLNGLITSGKHNMSLFLISEELQAIESCVNHNIRKNRGILDVEFDVIINPIKDWIVPLKIYPEKLEKSPCGKICSEQSCYQTESCLGCPATIFYRGKFL